MESRSFAELQKLDGSWDSAGLAVILQACSLAESTFEELKLALNGQLDLLLTIIALNLLEVHHSTPENTLVIRKAR